MIVLYKTFGTYERVRDDYETFYECRHLQSGQECTANTIKEAKQVLETLDRTYAEIREAIDKLTVHGYKVYKEVA
jgi:hypothetical protein